MSENLSDNYTAINSDNDITANANNNVSDSSNNTASAGNNIADSSNNTASTPTVGINMESETSNKTPIKKSLNISLKR